MRLSPLSRWKPLLTLVPRAMAAACNGAIVKFSSSVPRFRPHLNNLRSFDSKPVSFSFRNFSKRNMTTIACSYKRDQQSEETGTDELLSSDDASYLWKLAAGSIGGASAIKYGSILFPDITRPNILQGLLMVALPVLVAGLILIKESMTESQNDDLL